MPLCQNCPLPRRFWAKHGAALEKMIPGEGPFFNPNKRLAGSYYLACVLDMLTSAEPTALATTTKLKAFLAAMLALPEMQAFSALHPYYVKN